MTKNIGYRVNWSDVRRKITNLSYRPSNSNGFQDIYFCKIPQDREMHMRGDLSRNSRFKNLDIEEIIHFVLGVLYCLI